MEYRKLWIALGLVVAVSFLILGVAGLIRAVRTLRGERPPAKTIGWREIIFGAITVGLAAAGYLVA